MAGRAFFAQDSVNCVHPFSPGRAGWPAIAAILRLARRLPLAFAAIHP